MMVKEEWESPKGEERCMVRHSKSAGGRGTSRGCHSGVAEEGGESRKCQKVPD